MPEKHCLVGIKPLHGCFLLQASVIRGRRWPVATLARLGSAKGTVRGAPGWGTGAIGLIRWRLTERLADDLKQA